MSEVLPPYTPNQQKAAQTAMATEFQKPEVQSSLAIDIDNFTKTVSAITSSFEVVDRKLGEIDSKNLDPKKFQPIWGGYKKRYREMLWVSRDLATKIATQAEQFGTAMIPVISGDYGDPISDRLTQLQFFIKLNEQQGKDSEAMNSKFANLADEICAFKGTFNSFAEAHLGQLNKQIKDLEGEISGLNAELDSITSKIIGLTVALGLVVFATIALCVVFPASIATVASIGTTAAIGTAGMLSAAYDRRSTIVGEIKTKTGQLKNAAAAVKEIEQARTDLKNLGETEITTIVAGLQMLSDIWRNVHNDCKQIEQYLRGVESSNTDVSKDPNAPVLIRSYLECGVTIYSGLSQALKLYASGITNSRI